MVRFAIPALLAVALGASACSRIFKVNTDTYRPPEVRTSAPSYKAGATGGVLVVNKSGHTIGFNSCPITLEQLAGTTWRAMPGGLRGPETASACSTSFILVGSGDSTETRFTLAPNVAPGTYRLRLARVEGRDVAMGVDSTGARTNQFTVTP
jgi:hypothetical protein